MKINFLFFTFLLSICSYAQSQKIVMGKVTDGADNNLPLAYATVVVQGTQNGVNTDEEGYFEIEVNEDEFVLEASFLGYQTQELEVDLNILNEYSFILFPEDSELDDMVIVVRQNRANESFLLNQQRKSLEIKQNIGAEELSKKGVGDVASAVAKTSGISKQEGSNAVFVRGLGDRYNSTTLNGLPIPSNDPEKKNVNLEIFSTDIVDYISIDKAFSARNSGDFGGGNVDILSKDFRKGSLFQVSLGSNVNTNAVEKGQNFLLPEGPSMFGYANYGIPENPLNSYGYQNSLTPVNAGPIGGDIKFLAGRSFDLGGDAKLNLFATASFVNGYRYREGLNQTVGAQGVPLKSFFQEKSVYTTNTTGMFNTSLEINEDNKISYNLLYVNSSDLSRDIYSGYDRDFESVLHDEHRVQRGTFIQNTVLINQLLGNHTFNKNLVLDWGVSYNTIESDMPDRTQNKLDHIIGTDQYNLSRRTTTDNHRYFHNLKEDEIAANAVLNYRLGVNEESNEERGKISIGYNGRIKERNFEAMQFNFGISGTGMTQIVDPFQLNDFFNQQSYDNGLFTIRAFSGMTPQTYNGKQNIHAGFVNFEYRLTEKLFTVIGLRYENIMQKVDWRTQLDAAGGENTFKRNEFLPTVNLKYEINGEQNLRFAASKTYTLPQFKERALFIYEDVTETKFGNPYLYPSQNYNVDFKWEIFPQNDEVISAGVFGKYILDPINEVTMASSSYDITWVNIGNWGYAYGIELELKKNIIDFGGDLNNKLSAGLNASYLQTNQEIDSDKIRVETEGTISTNLTDKESSFTGASDFLINADITWNKQWSADTGFTATIAYNYYSDRLYALGVQGNGNLVDKAIGSFDFIFKTRVHKNLGIDFSARNLNNPEFRRVQENISGHVNAVTYKRGAFFSLGLNYSF